MIQKSSRKKVINRGRQLKFAREYRNIKQSTLCKSIKGLSQSNLSKFEKGTGYLSERILTDIMKNLDWPFEWLDKKSSQVNFN